MSEQVLALKRATVREKKQREYRMRLFPKLKPYLFMLPAIVLVGFWVYKPLLQTLQLSTYDWSMVPGTTPEFVGFKNFTRLLNNAEFWPAVKNTLFIRWGCFPFPL